MTGNKTGTFNGVDPMKTLFVAASVFAATLTMAAVPALAADDAHVCHTLASQTNSAISAATGDVSQARDEAREGLEACNFALYKNGADHYRKALSLLGK
jgi:hypothetical protein